MKTRSGGSYYGRSTSNSTSAKNKKSTTKKKKTPGTTNKAKRKHREEIRSNAGLLVGPAILHQEQKQKKQKFSTNNPNKMAAAAVLHQKDLWLNILSFVGPGHFSFIAGISKKIKEYYLEYFNTLKEEEIPKIKLTTPWTYRKTIATDTFYTAAFSSVACATYWNQDTKGSNDRLPVGKIFLKMARYGTVEVLKWARYQRGMPWYTDCDYSDYTIAAAQGGRLDNLQYLHKNGSHLSVYTFNYAAMGANLDCIKYLHQHDCPWNERTCSCAAERGSMEILQYLHENGCPWDESTCHMAAHMGHLEILQYARANGCPWNSRTISWAERYGHPEIAQWARDNGCPLPADEI